MKLLRLLAALLAFAGPAFFAGSALAVSNPKADDEKAQLAREEKILSELKFQTGNISLLGGRAEIHLGDKFEYLNAADSRKVIVDLLHNPPDVGDHTGILVPKGWARDASAPDWFAVLDWKEDGYIKDGEYDSINFDEMLSQLKESSKQASAERVQQGYSKLILTGWAQPPHYDKTTHKLFWAKAFDCDAPVQQLDYDINVLGRAGVLKVSIVSIMPLLAQIQAQAPTILSAIEFTPNNRYSDYKSGDKVAAYGIGGLIGVGLLAKAGFFKGIWLLLAKAGKFIIVGVVAVGAWIRRMLGGKKQA